MKMVLNGSIPKREILVRSKKRIGDSTHTADQRRHWASLPAAEKDDDDEKSTVEGSQPIQLCIIGNKLLTDQRRHSASLPAAEDGDDE